MFVQRLQESLPMDGALLSCKMCGAKCHVCSRCWRGQRYCGKDCSLQARKISLRRNQKKYSKTPKGRQAHIDKQKRYRKIHSRQKNSETDHTTALPEVSIKESQSPSSCLQCGARIDRLVMPLGFYSFRRNDRDAHP